MKEEILKIINKLIKEYEPDAIPQSYDDYSEGAEALRRLREKVSQMQLPVKPEIAETKARIEELERVLRLKTGIGNVFLTIPKVDITDRVTKLKQKIAEL